MMNRLASPVLALILPILAACGGADDADYPRLLPLDQLTREPAVPAHAADAVADPESVRGELRARAAAATSQAADIAQTGAGADALAGRAAALRARADALRRQDPGDDSALPSCPPGTVPDLDAADPAPTCTPD